MRLVLVAHGATAAVRRSAFPVDEPLERPTMLPAVDLPAHEEARCAPSLRCRQTAAALGLVATADPALTGLDHGTWAGRTLDEVATAEPAAMTRWLTDPEVAPPHGESMSSLLSRVGTWLRTVPQRPRGLLAVVDPAVVRAAVAHALGAPAAAVWRVDVDPLSVTVLVGEPGRWTLRELRTGPSRATGAPP